VLKDDGALILNEVSRSSLYSHLTFGLLEGWWLYEDKELRIPGCPGLSPESWEKVLKSEGFRSVSFPAEDAAGLGAQIIVADCDGTSPATALPGERNRPEKVGAVQADPGAMRNRISAGDTTSPGVSDSAMEEFVREIIKDKLSESLRIAADEIDLDSPFAEYGLDSVIGVNLVQVINRALSIGMETTS
jgi:acyl carrier protein